MRCKWGKFCLKAMSRWPTVVLLQSPSRKKKKLHLMPMQPRPSVENHLKNFKKQHSLHLQCCHSFSLQITHCSRMDRSCIQVWLATLKKSPQSFYSSHWHQGELKMAEFHFCVHFPFNLQFKSSQDHPHNHTTLTNSSRGQRESNYFSVCGASDTNSNVNVETT